MTRYYHLDVDSLGVTSRYDDGRAYVYGELTSQWEDDDSENIEFTVARADIPVVADFFMKFLEKHGGGSDE